MLGKDAEEILLAAAHEAKHRRHEYVCLEHLLFAIAKNRHGHVLLKALHANTERLLERLVDFFETKLEQRELEDSDTPQQAIGFQRAIQRAFLHARYSSNAQLSVGDFLAAIFTEPESHAVYFLSLEGITRLDVLEYISHGPGIEYSPDQASDDEDDADDEQDFDDATSESDDPLSRFTIRLTELARKGFLDPLVGRNEEIQRAIHVLCRRSKNNPLFVGDQGVGKTAIVEGLAQKVARGEVPERLQKIEIFSLDLGALLAGTKYRGDFEQRFKAVIRALQDIEQAVLFIDEIHTVIGAGATSGGTMDVANLLKPILTKDGFRCIGSTTFEEYKNHFSKDRALARRFLKIDVMEPSLKETIEILKGLQPRLEEHHGVRYSSSAVRLAAELAAKFINDRLLPDKAIDVLDEAGSLVSLAKQQTANKADPNLPAVRGAKAKKLPTVKANHIEQVVSSIARVPVQSVSTDDREKLRGLEKDLKQVVFGQDEAIHGLVKSIHRARAGLSQQSKPVGSFLFVGPTGVGKTEVSRQLAHALGLQLIRFDMSEYMEKHSVARLIGAPPGYVGYDQGGLLTDAIVKNPHAVLLLDEIEKAHPDIYNILLQVMDNATLTDNNGRKADFRNVILIMTSNVGSDGIGGQAIGFGDVEASGGRGALERTFRPEFRNRLDMIVRFKPLPIEVVESVVDKFIVEIEEQLRAKHVSITLSPDARRWLAETGYSVQYGARSIHRLIQEKLKDCLAHEILFGDLIAGGDVQVLLRDSQIDVEITPKSAAQSRKEASEIDTEESVE